MASWVDGYWRSSDGLRLHYRDYPGAAGPVPLLCIPGLTRNARDFEGVAARLAGGRRVIAVDLRGRGMSDYSPDPESYNPGVYLSDLQALLDQLGLDAVAVFGTSLGGIITMLLGAVGDPRLQGYLLNDIGPIVEEQGLERIRRYAGADIRWDRWDEAAAAMKATHSDAHPDFGPEEWSDMAHRLCRQTQDGSIVTDYDPAIAVLVARPTPRPPEPWKFLDGLRDLPGLLVHGALSNILSGTTAAGMVDLLPELELVTLPHVGHAPTLDEREVGPAIDRLLARIDARASSAMAL